MKNERQRKKKRGRDDDGDDEFYDRTIVAKKQAATKQAQAAEIETEKTLAVKINARKEQVAKLEDELKTLTSSIEETSSDAADELDKVRRMLL